MHNEEFDRKMDFIVNQQVQFAVDIQKLKEAQAATEQTVAGTTKNVANLVDVVSHLTSVTQEGFRFVFKSFNETNTKLDVLVDSQILTNERLQNLIDVVDRHIREGHRHNGAP